MIANYESLDQYYQVILEENLHHSKGNLQFSADTLFGDLNFQNKKFLDIGGGNGIYSFYAASKNCKKVVCLEPEAAGSNDSMLKKFRDVKDKLSCTNIYLESSTFQDYNPDNEKFDIVFLHNSINHLDELACINLLSSEADQQKYIGLFSKIYSLSNPGAKLIISDCSRYNFFTNLGLKNPMMPSIEWHKHQAPSVWSQLLAEAGFRNPKIEWLSFNTLRYFGKLLLSNKTSSYFLNSYFCLKMEK